MRKVVGQKRSLKFFNAHYVVITGFIVIKQ